MLKSRIMTNEEKTKKAAREKTRFELWICFLHLLAILVLGFSLFPMIFLLHGVWKAMAAYPVWLKVLAFSFSIPFGYFLFGTVLIFFCVFTKDLFRFKITPGLYTIHSMESLRWMGYNSMILLANSAFLDVLRLSPFQTLFYRKMGAKVGNGVNINTAGLADLSLLEIGDNVLIGGGVALICHASERGFIRLAPTKIGNNVSVGLGSVIMPDCEIGDGAAIAPCSLLPKGTKIPPKGVWGGNPARDLRAERREGLSLKDRN
jgi:non-ribosomal peptide synthetase-like protein